MLNSLLNFLACDVSVIFSLSAANISFILHMPLLNNFRHCFITTSEIHTFYYSSALLTHKLLHIKMEDTHLNHLNNCYDE